MKKIFTLVSIIVAFVTLVACAESTDDTIKDITLSISNGPISLEVGETHQLQITTNDPLGFDIDVSNTNVIEVTNEGLITAIDVGSATVKVTSKTDEEVFKNIDVLVVEPTVELSIVEPTAYLWEGQTLQLEFEADGEVTFSSSNELVATVADGGLITAIAPGDFTITMTLKSDSSVETTIDLKVYDVATTILIEGKTKLNTGSTVQLTTTLGPETSVPEVLWTSSDEMVAQVSADGVVTPVGTGLVVITATSIADDEVFANHEMTIYNELAVDLTKNEGDKVVINDLEFIYGESLFNSLEVALNRANDGAKIHVFDMTLDTSVTLDKSHLTLVAATDDVVFTKQLTIDAPGITIDGFKFSDEGFIKALESAENLTVIHNEFNNLDASVLAAIDVALAATLYVDKNTISNVDGHAILVREILDGKLDIKNNIIKNTNVAVEVFGTTYSEETSLQIAWNDIEDIETAFKVMLAETEIPAFVRFNSVANYSDKAAIANLNSNIDFTLNFWGSQTLDLNDFENIPERMLIGHYEEKADVVSEANFDPEVVLFIFVTTNLDTLWVGEELFIEYEYLPYELNNARFRFRTTDADTLMVEGTGKLIPKQSGEATITISASARTSDAETSIDLNVTTDPGIDLIPSVDTQSLIAGDNLTIEAIPFPITIQDKAVTFESSNDLVATVDENGVVTSHTAGQVIITVRLADDSEVYETYYVTFYESLDENNLLDLLTLNQQAYLKKHDFWETGTGPSYRVVGYESVSNFYFDEIIIDTTKMIPDQYKGGNVRPGYALSDIPEPAITYNDKNVHWITVHDTANTDPSSSALSHANYLLGQAANNGATVSWHYTIDDYEMYQHIPEGEVAWHAGDGSALVGQHATYLGGGNRNAIAIEMNVGMGDDLYRTWQRTAKWASQTLVKYNLPREHIKFHQHFSGKHCPNALLVSGLEPKFQKMADVEYKVASNYSGAQISMVSSNPEIVDHTGRVISMPAHNTTVSYTITVILDGVTSSRTFNVFVPGTTR